MRGRRIGGRRIGGRSPISLHNGNEGCKQMGLRDWWAQICTLSIAQSHLLAKTCVVKRGKRVTSCWASHVAGRFAGDLRGEPGADRGGRSVPAAGNGSIDPGASMGERGPSFGADEEGVRG